MTENRQWGTHSLMSDHTRMLIILAVSRAISSVDGLVVNGKKRPNSLHGVHILVEMKLEHFNFSPR